MPTLLRHYFVDKENRPLWFEDLTNTPPRSSHVSDPITGDRYFVHSISSSPSGDKIVVVRPLK